MSKKQKGFVEYVKQQYLKRGIIIDRVKIFGRTICLYSAGEIVYSIERPWPSMASGHSTK